MALTRKFLSALGIEAEKIDEIINAHTETVNALKEERDGYKEAAEKLPGVQKELNDLKEAGNSEDGYKQKYEDEHAAFENYKTEMKQKEDTRQKQDAYRKLLISSNIDESRIDAILRVTEFSNLELKDGKFEDEDKLKKNIDAEWAGFKKSPGSTGAEVDNPPSDGGAMTKEAFDKLPLNERMAYANEHPAEASEFLK